MLGVASSLTNIDISYNGSLSGNSTNDLLWQIGVYGGWTSGNFFVDFLGAIGLNWYNSKELISAFGVTRKGDFTGTQYNAKISVGYDWRVGPVVVTPSLTFNEIHLDVDPYRTTGGAPVDLNVAGQHMDVQQLKFGNKITYPLMQSNWTFVPEVHGYYIRNLNTSRVHTTVSFVGGGSSFTLASPARDPDLLDFGLGVTVKQKGPFTLGFVYDYTFGQSTTDSTFYLRAKTEF